MRSDLSSGLYSEPIMMAHGISVIICCYNGEERIGETLKHLLVQKIPVEIQWEVILVNNASTDQTINVAKRILDENGQVTNLRIVNESIPGLASARRAGTREAKFDILIFCDDDNSLDENYVAKANELMSSMPETGIAGGWVRPGVSLLDHYWIEDLYSSLAIDKDPKPSGYVDWVYGAGMIIRKNVIEDLTSRGISLLLSDRVGKKQTSGGDAEMCLAVRFMGYRIYYSPELIIDHCIATHRLTKGSFIRANYRNVFPVVYLYLMENLMTDRNKTAAELFRKFFGERISMVFHFFPRSIFGQHRFYSLIMLFQNVQLFFWLLLKKHLFNSTHTRIINNLYHG
jgi:glycosyltransferase involved in cell wall biosynthesis